MNPLERLERRKFRFCVDNDMDYGYVMGLAFGEYDGSQPVWRNAVRADRDEYTSVVRALRALADSIEKHYEST